MLIARASWQPEPKLLGLAYCRRSWCHRLVVDFVAVHPHVVGRLHERIRGIGTGLFHGLIQIADDLGIGMIWGEATANSASFYEKILGAESVLDQFHIHGETMNHSQVRLHLVRWGLGTCRGGAFACWHSAVAQGAMARQVGLAFGFSGSRMIRLR